MTAVVLRGDAAHLPLPDGSVDLIVAEVNVEDSADPDMIRLVVYCCKPGT